MTLKIFSISLPKEENLIFKILSFFQNLEIFSCDIFLQFYKGILHKLIQEIFSSVFSKHNPRAWCQRGAMVAPYTVWPA